ncbi:MAG: protein translocase subunit SecF [Pseudomonadota bacterium]|nr:MAG: protein translocase subunit SecF [Pseudomonadota bacterium]
MEIIKPGTTIDFLGKRRTFVTASFALVLLILVLIPLRVNLGVDFAGGTEIEVKFHRAVEVEKLRGQVAEAGFGGASVQQIGSADENAFLIRVGQVSVLSDEDLERYREAFARELSSYGFVGLSFNPSTGDLLDLRTEREVPEAELLRAARAAGLPLTQRGEPVRNLTRAGQPAYQFVIQGLSDKVSEALQAEFGQDVEVRRVEFVGPQVGKQLRNRGIMAVLLAMVGIVLYVLFRFDVRFAPGTLVGLVHDVVITTGYWVVTGREFNLTSIAVLLTVVGYSVNDKVVVFDRVREVAARRKGMSLYDTINTAVNETLSRTIVTGLTTVIALLGFLVFARGSIFDFSAAMILGILAGTYSSIFVAGPIALVVDRWVQKRETERKVHESKTAQA